METDPDRADKPEDYYPEVARLAARYAKGRPTTPDDMAQAGVAEVLTRWFAFDAALSSRRTWVLNVAAWGMRDALRSGEGHALIRLPKSAARRGEVYPQFVGLRQKCYGKNSDDARYRDVHLPDPRDAAPAPTDPGEFLSLARSLAGRPLTKSERGALLLHFVRGMTQRDAASHMGVTESRVCGVLGDVVRACREKAAVTA